jgi:hypothetical protein
MCKTVSALPQAPAPNAATCCIDDTFVIHSLIQNSGFSELDFMYCRMDEFHDHD